MTASNHIVAGALIAVAVKNPALALPLAFASHFVLDALPHFGIQGGVRVRNRSPLFRNVTSADIAVSVVLLFLLPVLLHNRVAFLDLYLCIAAAYFMDFFWVYRFFREVKGAEETKGNWLMQFHRNVQWMERPWGIVVEIIFFLAVLFFII